MTGPSIRKIGRWAPYCPIGTSIVGAMGHEMVEMANKPTALADHLEQCKTCDNIRQQYQRNGATS